MIKNLNKKNKKKGFTLIELIIVIAIIAILAAVAIPRFGAVRRNANIKADIANAKNIQSAAAVLLGDNDLEYSQTYTLDAGTDDDADVIENYLQNIPETRLVQDGNFVVVIDATGGIIVSIDDGAAVTQVYPNAAAPYNE